MNNLKTRRLVMTALLSAIIIVMTFVPYTGYIQTPVFSITTIHIPVIIGAILLGPIDGAVLGLVWGITSLLKSIGLPEQAIFINPLISVLPRIIVGFVVGLVAKYVVDKIKNKKYAYATCAAVGTLTNTILVLSAIGLFAASAIGIFVSDSVSTSIGKTFITIVKIVVGTNGLIELVCAAVLVPIITSAVVKSAK